MSMRFLSKALVSLSLLACSAAFAVPVTYTITAPIASNGMFGDPDNFVATLDVGAYTVITNFRFDVNLTANDPSFLSDLQLVFSDSIGSAPRAIMPAFLDENPGMGNYAGSADLSALGLSIEVGADGILRLEFSESFDDPEVMPDGIWNSGTITFNFDDAVDPGTNVPEPASILLISAGFAMMGYAGRRRASNKAAA